MKELSCTVERCKTRCTDETGGLFAGQDRAPLMGANNRLNSAAAAVPATATSAITATNPGAISTLIGFPFWIVGKAVTFALKP
jgi:hypothetical protein